MRLRALVSRIADWAASRLHPARPARLEDRVSLDLPFCSAVLERRSDLDTPHEVTIVIPRVEVRGRKGSDGAAELEVVLSSVTIAHSPRPAPSGHPQSGAS